MVSSNCNDIYCGVCDWSNCVTRLVYEVEEDVRDASVCVELSEAAAPLVDAVWLNVATASGNATNGTEIAVGTSAFSVDMK